MSRSALEVADIFRAHGPHWRSTQTGHLSLGQLKAMSAIERCRSAALGGHMLQCRACDHTQIAYNSCRNRHCPKCQASAMCKVTDEPTDAVTNAVDTADSSDASATYVCPDCGAPMLIIETFERGQLPRAPPVSVGES